MKPWEKYQQTDNVQPAQSLKPWEKYSGSTSMPAVNTSRLIEDTENLVATKKATEKVDVPADLAVSQGAYRGLGADLLGAPVDLITMFMNAGSSLLNKLPGVNLPNIQNPVGGSDWIADKVSTGAEKIGYPVFDPNKVEGGDKYLYNIVRFGSGAGAGGLALASRAAKTGQAVNAMNNTTKTSRVEQALTALYKEYKDGNMGRQIADDVIAGGGAGAGYTVAEDIAPDSPLAQIFGAILGGGATSVGSRVAESGVKSMGRGIVKSTPGKALLPDSLRDKVEFYNERLPDGTVEKKQTVQDAALMMQKLATDPKNASERIKQSIADSDEAGMTRLTPGVAGDDIGLGAFENYQRLQNARPFMERDQQIRTDVSNSISNLRNPNADVEAPQRMFREEADRQVGEAASQTRLARQKVSSAQLEQEGIGRQVEEITEPFLAQRGRKFEASKTLDEQIGKEGALGQRTKLKNEKFEEAAGDKAADVTPIADSLRKVEKEINELGFENTGIPADFVKKIRAALPGEDEYHTLDHLSSADLEKQLKETNLADLAKIESSERSAKKLQPLAEEYALFKTVFEQAKKDGALEDLAKSEGKDPRKYAAEMEANLKLRKEELDKLKLSKNEEIRKGYLGTGNAPKEPEIKKTKEIKLKDLSRVRRDITSSIARARKAGNFDLADNLATLKSDINAYVDRLPEFDEAQKYYREEYAPFFAEGYGKKYRDTVQKGEGVGASDPGKIADIFLNGTPDAAADLKKIISIAPDSKAASGAVEKYMAADFASSIGNNPSPRTIANWIKNRSAQLDQFPEIKQKFQDLQRKVGSKEIEKDELKLRIDDLSDQFRQAEKNLDETKRRVNRGVFGALINNDPDKYVGEIMGAKDRLKRLDEVNNLIGKNEQAKEGFKRAVTEDLIRKIEGSDVKSVNNDKAPILYNKINSVMKENEDALAKVYSPKEMNALRRSQKILSQYGNLNRRATVGSDTVQKLQNQQYMDAMETWFRVQYGVLKAGGIMRTIKGAARILPEGRVAKADRLVARAMLDPEVAVHLLDSPASQIGTAKWNKRLTYLLAGQAGVRESVDGHGEDDQEE